MTARHCAPLLLSASFVTLIAASPGLADSTIKVSLWDKGPDSMVMDDAHMAMMGKMDMTMMAGAMMGVTLDKVTVPAGKITFDVVNDSKDIVHEFMVSPVTAGETELPYIADENRVDEEKAGHLGEVSELDPGKSGSLTVALTPGTYIAYCNIPGHFIDGMWTLLTVTP
ncbi:MAG: hypothetical protein H7317_14050 [Pseudorhodobacter sp.]|nr:hypothetical protein [Pseudorhodobacter sp.]